MVMATPRQTNRLPGVIITFIFFRLSTEALGREAQTPVAKTLRLLR